MGKKWLGNHAVKTKIKIPHHNTVATTYPGIPQFAAYTCMSGCRYWALVNWDTKPYTVTHFNDPEAPANVVHHLLHAEEV